MSPTLTVSGVTKPSLFFEPGPTATTSASFNAFFCAASGRYIPPAVFSVGFSKSSEREFKVWDTRNFKQPLVTKALDNASGSITPVYDAGTGVIFLAGRGDANISYFELLDTDPWQFGLTSYQSNVPQVDIAPLPKTMCDVAEVEITRILKLTTSLIEPLSFQVPRLRLEFFQDDLFPDTPSSESVLTGREWLNGVNRDPKLVNLRPSGMQPLSLAPKIQKEKKYKFNPKKEEEDKTSLQDKVKAKLNEQMQTYKEDDVRNYKNLEGEGCADDEWD